MYIQEGRTCKFYTKEMCRLPNFKNIHTFVVDQSDILLQFSALHMYWTLLVLSKTDGFHLFNTCIRMNA